MKSIFLLFFLGYLGDQVSTLRVLVSSICARYISTYMIVVFLMQVQSVPNPGAASVDAEATVRLPRRSLQQQNPVAVLLSISDSNTVVIDPKTGKVEPASSIDVTRCIQRARGGGGGNNSGKPPVARRRAVLQQAEDPPLDLSQCQGLSLDVTSSAPQVRLQLLVNAIVQGNQLPVGAVSTSGGTLGGADSSGSVQGAFTVFDLTLSIQPNAPVSVYVPANALADVVGGPTAASNTFSVTYDNQGPQVRRGRIRISPMLRLILNCAPRHVECCPSFLAIDVVFPLFVE
jgi:hypothetical protein